MELPPVQSTPTMCLGCSCDEWHPRPFTSDTELQAAVEDPISQQGTISEKFSHQTVPTLAEARIPWSGTLIRYQILCQCTLVVTAQTWQFIDLVSNPE